MFFFLNPKGFSTIFISLHANWNKWALKVKIEEYKIIQWQTVIKNMRLYISAAISLLRKKKLVKPSIIRSSFQIIKMLFEKMSFGHVWQNTFYKNKHLMAIYYNV